MERGLRDRLSERDCRQRARARRAASAQRDRRHGRISPRRAPGRGRGERLIVGERPGDERRTPTSAEIGRQFSEQARHYAVSKIHLEGVTRLTLIEHMEPVADETLLDVGTGPGPLALAFAPYVSRAVGFDLSTSMLHAARLAARRAEVENLRLVAGDVHRLPFPDRSFDLVTSRACPHHFTDIRAAVREMARVLRRGGRFGISD